MIRNISGGVTAAKGFSAACCAAGIKYQDRTDMAMLYSTVPCNAAGTFTTNKVKAAPVLWDRDIVSSGCPAQAVVVNAGIANAATGKTGLDLCRKTAEAAGKILDIPASSVLIGSTGVIGPNIPLDKITAGVSAMAAALSDTQEAGTAASRAIMTTDTVICRILRTARGEWRGHRDRSPRRHVQGFRHDPSQHVHHARISHHRLRHFP